MAVYWPIFFCFFLAFSWTETKSRSIKTQKIMRPEYPAILTEQGWSIKYLFHGQMITPKNFTFAGTKRAIPSGHDRPILPAQVANQNFGFTSSCLLAEPAI